MVNCKLNEILLGDVAAEIYANFQIVQRNKNDLIFICWSSFGILFTFVFNFVSPLKGSHPNLGNQGMSLADHVTLH